MQMHRMIKLVQKSDKFFPGLYVGGSVNSSVKTDKGMSTDLPFVK